MKNRWQGKPVGNGAFNFKAVDEPSLRQLKLGLSRCVWKRPRFCAKKSNNLVSRIFVLIPRSEVIEGFVSFVSIRFLSMKIFTVFAFRHAAKTSFDRAVLTLE